MLCMPFAPEPWTGPTLTPSPMEYDRPKSEDRLGQQHAKAKSTGRGSPMRTNEVASLFGLAQMLP